MADIALEARHLTKVYDNGTIGVQDLSLTVYKGEVVGLLGPNGSGKTTTVNLFTTTFLPTKGTAKVMGYDVVADRDKVRQLVALVPQQDTVNWWLTVYQNLDLFASLLGIPCRTRQRVIGRLLEEFELSDKRNHFLDDLSGGQIRRVQIVRALLYRPQVLFVDEPTLGLDPLGVRKVLDYLKSLRKEGVTIVFSTNEMEQAEKVCDRVIFLHKGRLLDQGMTVDFIRRHTNVERVEILYKGAAPAFLEGFFRDREGVQLQSLKPLVYSSVFAGGGLISELLLLLMNSGTEIEDVKIKKPGLREAFIQLVEGEHCGESFVHTSSTQ